MRSAPCSGVTFIYGLLNGWSRSRAGRHLPRRQISVSPRQDLEVCLKNLYIVSMNWAALAARIDKSLDRLYGYHGPAIPPALPKTAGRVWLALPGLKPTFPANTIHKRYYVNQRPAGWVSPNECVTAATVQGMNMMQDILAAAAGFPAPPHADLTAFAADFDRRGPLAWFTRPPATVPVVGGMLLPQLALRVLKAHVRALKRSHGCTYRVTLTTHNTVDDLIANLRKGYPTSIHVSQPVALFRKGKYSDYRALLGGVPHTVSLAGYDPRQDTWLILDPSPYATADYTRWTTRQLMDLWGRKSLFYPPIFSTRPAYAMTTLTPD
jgi:hypothetical protein